MIDFEDLILNRLNQTYEIKPFDCGDADLNGFLFDDAKNYLSELMATTYILEYKDCTVAYFCLLNDKVVFDTSDTKEKSFWNRFNRKNKIPNDKRRQNYPAVKIGRLAVSEDFSGCGIGRFILDTVKSLLSNKRDIACRFITVDAYNTAFNFYEKNEFNFLSDEDKGTQTRLMYFDLKSLSM
ncbi:GNAT superfamily N-acetyltransferase [Dysgonomonadaceae bacterium PH5-43]|nr:GNAT superfamily N-acetyltransferase [Dysgonomonadaceae bacterium PH5-43]